MSSTKINFSVSGYLRDAASARVLTVAPRPWMSEGGVCPSSVTLRSRIGDAGLPVQSIEQFRSIEPAHAHGFTRQFKQQQGSRVPRPPV